MGNVYILKLVCTNLLQHYRYTLNIAWATHLAPRYHIIPISIGCLDKHIPRPSYQCGLGYNVPLFLDVSIKMFPVKEVNIRCNHQGEKSENWPNLSTVNTILHYTEQMHFIRVKTV